MTESLITEWLADCAEIGSPELKTFASGLLQDVEIVRALYVLLEERSKYSELVDTVCNQLFNFYRSREIELQRFTLQFVPTLIFIYLNSVAHGDIKNCRSVETLLISLYNLEVVDETGQPKAVSFRLPSLAMHSIYHEPSSLAPASLTESAVRRFEECNSKLVSWGPLQQVETLNAQNRLKVMTALLFIYNQQLSFISKPALEQLCKVATKIVTQGFSKPGHHQRSSYGSESSFVPRLLPRIPISNQFLLEFLHGIYFSMYNDCWYVGSQAVEDVHSRACYDAYPDVMLVTNAIRNSSSSGPSGALGDGSMGISVALSPATTTPTISKSMITNASFRTKKLPDDLDANLFDEERLPQLSRPSSGGSKRRAWLRKHLNHSLDEEDLPRGTSSGENSRRESLTSAGSPGRGSPRRRDRKDAIQDEALRRPRKDRERSNSPGNESRLSAGARLYRVLEEQALGEAIVASIDTLYVTGVRAVDRARPTSLSTAAATSHSRYTRLLNRPTTLYDIPIVAKEDGGVDGKVNLVSITEEQDPTTVDPVRGGSMRARDSGKSSKITNFSLSKKPREKENKSAKNGYVSAAEKKKDSMSSGQTTSKEATKMRASALLNEGELDNGSVIKKKNDSNIIMGSNDANISLTDVEQRHLSTDGSESIDLENSSSLRGIDQDASSVQVSTV